MECGVDILVTGFMILVLCSFTYVSVWKQYPVSILITPPSEKGVEFPSGWRVLYCGISEAKRVCPDMFESINFQLLNSSHEYSSRRWCSVEG